MIGHTKRKLIKRRDGYVCQICGCRNHKILEIHHIIPKSQGGNNDPDNLVTVCHKCHVKIHNNEIKYGVS